MSFKCGLSDAKISLSTSVIANEKWQASVSARNFAIAAEDVPVTDILATVEEGLPDIFPARLT